MKTQNNRLQEKSFQSYLLITKEPAQESISNFLKTLNIKVPQNSPDFTIATPEKESLSVNEAKEIRKLVFQKPIQSKYKIVAILNSDKLSPIVQNSFLKILEEPPEHAIIILTATSTENVLPTILSRVITIFSKTRDDQKQDAHTNYTLNSLEDLITIEDPKNWVDHFLVSKYNELLKTQEHKESIRIRKSIEVAQETKSMIEANVNPKFALMSLWLKTR